MISVEKVADAAEHQKLVKRPPRDLRVNFLLNAKAAFLQKLKEGGFKEGAVEGVGDCMFIAPQAYHEIEHPEALDDATRDLKVTSMRKSIVEAVGAGKRTTSMVPLHVRQAIASYFGDELKVRLRLTLSRPFLFIRPFVLIACLLCLVLCQRRSSSSGSRSTSTTAPAARCARWVHGWFIQRNIIMVLHDDVFIIKSL